MEHSALDSIRGEAHEIKLNGSRLLDKGESKNSDPFEL